MKAWYKLRTDKQLRTSRQDVDKILGGAIKTYLWLCWLVYFLCAVCAVYRNGIVLNNIIELQNIKDFMPYFWLKRKQTQVLTFHLEIGKVTKWLFHLFRGFSAIFFPFTLPKELLTLAPWHSEKQHLSTLNRPFTTLYWTTNCH